MRLPVTLKKASSGPLLRMIEHMQTIGSYKDLVPRMVWRFACDWVGGKTVPTKGPLRTISEAVPPEQDVSPALGKRKRSG
jgi:hypothetical protein